MTEVWELPTRRLGRRVVVYPRTDSTNSRALELAGQPESDGVAVLADEQTTGRGQHGRRWLAAPRSSVLLSVLLYPPPAVNRPVLLTAWAAVSVCEVVRRLTGVPPRIKWPNDVLLGGRKVCGILIEQARQGDVPATVVGIGLNVTQSEAALDAAGLPEATSLAATGAADADTHAVARQLLGVLDDGYDQLCRGEFAALEEKWQRLLGVIGEHVVIEGSERHVRGKLLHCSFDHLALRQADGVTVRLAPEGVRHIRLC